MASKTKNKHTKRLVRGTSAAALSDAKGRLVSPPTAAPDIPHPLGELPPEAGESSRRSHKKRTAKESGGASHTLGPADWRRGAEKQHAIQG
jgi:hypothetical protein